MNDDLTLLRRYAETGSQSAFRALVERHLGLVHHAALRQLGGDAHRARDVAQCVFADLARKAPTLARRPVVLTGWLHTATRHACARIRRAEHRRRRRETEAARMNPVDDHSGPAPSTPDRASADWEKLRPVIDEALHALSERDRDAVLLRFFEGRAYAEIGARLALSEDAARRRVDRGLDQLRAVLARRGVASTASALGLALGAQAGLAPPAGLAAAVSAAALAQVTAGGAGLAAGAAWTWSAKAGLAAGAAACVLGLGYWISRERTPAPDAGPTVLARGAASPAALPLTAADLLGDDDLTRLRGVSAADLGRLLVELWQLGTPAARARFAAVFDHWCGTAPEDAARWATITRAGEIGAPKGRELREKSLLAWAARDLDAAYAWSLTQPDRGSQNGLAAALLSELAGSDPAGAFDRAVAGGRELREAVLGNVLTIWATTAPRAALAALESAEGIENASRLARDIHLVWAEREPGAATRSHLSTTPPGDGRNELHMWLLQESIAARVDPAAVSRATLEWWAERPGTAEPVSLQDFPAWGVAYSIQAWARKDPATAVAFVAGLPEGPLRELVLERIAGTSRPSPGAAPPLPYEPDTGLALIGLIADEEARGRWTASFVEGWAQVDPEAALAWAREQPDASLRTRVEAGAFRAIAAQEPATALATWEGLRPDAPREALALALAEGWAKKEPAVAVAWFAERYPDPAPGTWMHDLFEPWMQQDPEAATAWAERSTNERMRRSALSATQAVLLPEGLAHTVRLAPDSESRVSLLRARAAWWLERDRATATKFLSETPLLTPEEKAQLLAPASPGAGW
jgi:RNA polymerase sigma factor (sigma-70 family)